MGGKQIRLFLVDGTPGGLTTLEVGQWVGHLVSGPRNQAPTSPQNESDSASLMAQRLDQFAASRTPQMQSGLGR